MNLFTDIDQETGKLRFSNSGGPFSGIKISELKPTNQEKHAFFWTWGHDGPRANGGINFAARVRVWKATIQV